MPGAGDLDFAAIFKTLNATGYSGPLTWDMEADDGDPDAVCKKTFKFAKSASKN